MALLEGVELHEAGGQPGRFPWSTCAQLGQPLLVKDRLHRCGQLPALNEEPGLERITSASSARVEWSNDDSKRSIDYAHGGIDNNVATDSWRDVDLEVSLPRNRRRPILLAGVAALSATVMGLFAQPAGAASSWQSIRYAGESFQVPSSWPVYDLAGRPTTCVRFDRHAVYEGVAGGRGDCPARSIGVSEAVEVQPMRSLAEYEDSSSLRSITINGQQAFVSTNDQVTHRVVAAFPTSGVLATISFAGDRTLADEILHSFASTTPTKPSANKPWTSRAERAVPRAMVSDVAPVLFTGIGFDVCQAPSEQQMAAWKANSPYGAIGVYIGGANAACTNITASWVSDEANAGWYMFPLYVGLQSPCVYQQGLAEINPADAASEGTAAADDAVNQAESFDMGHGATIYYDMEAWATNESSCSAAVTTFTAAWTEELHRAGYGSGFYSSADAGINQVIVPMYGHAGAPDDIDIAQWDGIASTSSSFVPSADWAHHQRIKQYSGNVTETWGGVTLQLDQDDIDAEMVGDPRPSITGVSPSSHSVATATTVAITGAGFAPGATTVRFGSVAGRSVVVTASNRLTVKVPAQALATVNVTVSTGGGTSVTSGADRFTYVPIVGMAVDPATGGYWLITSKGNVYNVDAPFLGSTALMSLPAPVVAIAATRTGYLLVTSKGNVYNFNTAFYGSTARESLPAPVVGISELPSGGYYLATAKGNVYNFNTAFYGSMALKSLPAPVVAIAATRTGYLLVTSKGNVYNFHTPFDGSTAHKSLSAPVVGAVADRTTSGYWLVTSHGNVDNFDAPFDGSTALQSLLAPVVGVATTATGYVFATAEGNIYNFPST
jgi:hypothetical protein